MPQRHLRNLQKCNNHVVSHGTGSWHTHQLKKMDLGILDRVSEFGIPLDTFSHFFSSTKWLGQVELS